MLLQLVIAADVDDVDDVVSGGAFEFPTLHLELELAILALNRTGLPLDFFPSDPGLHMSISSLSLAVCGRKFHLSLRESGLKGVRMRYNAPLL